MRSTTTSACRKAELASPRAKSHQRVGDRRQLLVLDLDQRCRIIRDPLTLRDDGDDGMPVEERAIDGERRDVAIAASLVRERQVGAGEHADDAGQRGGARGVDTPDVRVGVRAQHEPRVQHARQLHVARKARDAGHLLWAVEAGDGTADLGHRGTSHRGAECHR